MAAPDVAEGILEPAREQATIARRLAKETEERCAEALTAYNQALREA